MRIPESFDEEEDWERQDKVMKQQELKMKDECKKHRNKIIDTLTDENIKHLVEENNDYLEAIVRGDVTSWRQSIESRTKAEEMITNIGSLPSEDDIAFKNFTK